MGGQYGIAFWILGKPIYWYGILIASAVMVGIWLATREYRRRGYNGDIMLDFVLLAVPLAIVGARIYYVAFTWEMFAGQPWWKVFAIWEGGMAIYGAVIGGIVAALIFAKWKKVSFWDIVDSAAPSLILGQAVGRWGNFFNHEAYGYLINDPAWQWFPAAVNINGEWHMATFFYESFWNVLVFLFLMFYFRKKAKRKGDVFLMYLSLYGLGRMVIEGLRMDSLWLIPDVIRISQVLAGAMFIGGLIWMVLWHRNIPESQRAHLLLGKLPKDYPLSPPHEKKRDASNDAIAGAVKKVVAMGEEDLPDASGENDDADKPEK